MKEANKVISAVCEYFKCDEYEILRYTRVMPNIKHRQILFYLLKEWTRLSEIQIAKMCSLPNAKYHRTTIWHAHYKVKSLLHNKDREILNIIYYIENIYDDKNLSELSMRSKIDELLYENHTLKRKLEHLDKETLNNMEMELVSKFSMLSDDRKSNALSQIKASIKVQNMEHQKLRAS